jgi:hypothetical protein
VLRRLCKSGRSFSSSNRGLCSSTADSRPFLLKGSAIHMVVAKESYVPYAVRYSAVLYYINNPHRKSPAMHNPRLASKLAYVMEAKPRVPTSKVHAAVKIE